MTKKEFCNEVSRAADTQKQKIDVTITYRVLRCAFDLLREMPFEEAVRMMKK